MLTADVAPQQGSTNTPTAGQPMLTADVAPQQGSTNTPTAGQPTLLNTASHSQHVALRVIGQAECLQGRGEVGKSDLYF